MRNYGTGLFGESCSTTCSYSMSLIFGIYFANTSTITTAIAFTLAFETPRDGEQPRRGTPGAHVIGLPRVGGLHHR